MLATVGSCLECVWQGWGLAVARQSHIPASTIFEISSPLGHIGYCRVMHAINAQKKLPACMETLFPGWQYNSFVLFYYSSRIFHTPGQP